MGGYGGRINRPSNRARGKGQFGNKFRMATTTKGHARAKDNANGKQGKDQKRGKGHQDKKQLTIKEKDHIGNTNC